MALPLFIGLDAGGTKTLLLARAPDGRQITTMVGPAANLKREGVAGSAHVLATLVRETLDQHGGSVPAGICAGVAGLGSDEDAPPLEAALREALGPHGTAPIHLVHDAAIALEGAFEGGSGIITITGTGSVALAKNREGVLCKVGGWGYLVGDEGSGHKLGIYGLRAVAHDFDGGPATVLRSLLAERHGLATRAEILDAVYLDDWPVQRMAPLVIEAAEAGDAPARNILNEQARLFARCVGYAATRCGEIEERVALLGGLVQARPYRAALIAAIGEELPGWRFQKPLHAPVEGAVRLAAHHAGHPAPLLLS